MCVTNATVFLLIEVDTRCKRAVWMEFENGVRKILYFWKNKNKNKKTDASLLSYDDLIEITKGSIFSKFDVQVKGQFYES